MNVALRPEASSDLVSAAAYFNDISDGWGDHFLDAIEVDLADLRREAGIHALHYGLPCKFAKLFPFAIYYRVEIESANRAQQLDVWREPFVHLRLPLLFNLRRDPFEKSQQNSNTYHDWMIDRAFVLVPLQALASKFLMTLKDFPPSQKPGDWSLDSLEKQIQGMTTGGE